MHVSLSNCGARGTDTDGLPLGHGDRAVATVGPASARAACMRHRICTTYGRRL